MLERVPKYRTQRLLVHAMFIADAKKMEHLRYIHILLNKDTISVILLLYTTSVDFKSVNMRLRCGHSALTRGLLLQLLSVGSSLEVLLLLVLYFMTEKLLY